MHLVKMKAAASRAGNGEVAHVCGIQGAAEKAYPAAQPVVMRPRFVQLVRFDILPALRGGDSYCRLRGLGGFLGRAPLPRYSYLPRRYFPHALR